MRTIPLCISLLLAFAINAQFNNPLAIPLALEEDTFHLVVDEHVREFYPGVFTATYGASAEYLGPTLILNEGDTARIQVQNELAQHTNMHWHGLHLPGEFDGGPPRMVMPGETWDVKFAVKNPAATFWYHPHPHELTAEQTTFGVAGMIIVRDDAEAALDLPRTYGVDDIPLVLQDRRFLANGSFAFGPFGDSVLVNGTPRPYIELPAQVVRLRLLNGSNARVYNLGFDDGRAFPVIAGDGGLLSAPASTDRLRLSNGERAEVLLDLSGMQGDSLMLMSFGSELPSTIPGSSYILWESSALSGIDFPVLRIRVAAPTATPVTEVPVALVPTSPPSISDVSVTRNKSFSGTGMAGMGQFFINGLQFNMDVVNDSVMLGATEIWRVENASSIAHPFHIHGGSFYLIDRNDNPVPAWEEGAKDVVLVDVAEHVRFIMKFEDYTTDGWPFMYHCHNLMHEDDGMMLQYVVVDPNVAVPAPTDYDDVSVFPSPTQNILSFTAPFPVEELSVVDGLGREVMQQQVPKVTGGSIDLSSLRSGVYVLLLNGGSRSVRTLVMRD
jgi:bilirubin oxidase